jgi:hypothetical protein
MQRYFTSKNLVDALKLSGADTKSTCVGKVTEGHREKRCWNVASKAAWDEGFEILTKLPDGNHDIASLEHQLTLATEMMLCWRHAESQKEEVARCWAGLQDVNVLVDDCERVDVHSRKEYFEDLNKRN